MEDERPHPRHRRVDEDSGSRRFATGFATLRDLLSFAAGMVVIAHEVFFSTSVEPSSIAVGVALTGLPLVLGADERRSK